MRKVLKQMNIASCIKKTILFTLIIATSPLQPSADITEINQPAQDMQQEIMQGMLNYKRAELIKIDAILQDLLLLISSDAIKVKNRKQCVATAKDIRDFITNVLEEPFVHIDLNSLNVLNKISTALMEHLIKALDKNLGSLPPFDPSIIISRNPLREVTMPELQRDFTHALELSKQLKKKSKTAGLHWYNKLYRAFDKLVIQPGSKYKLDVRGRRLAVLGLTGTYMAWMNNDLELPFLRYFLGFAPHRPGGALNLDFHKTHPLNWFGNFHNFCSDKTNGNAAFAPYLFGVMWTDFLAESSTTLNTISNKLNSIHNKLKGGTYAEKPEQKFLFKPRFMFKDLVGLDHAKETLSFIVKYLEDPERFDRARLTPEKGYLLTGPTRTGKSAMAEALAGEIQEMYRRKGRNPDDFKFFVLTAPFIMQEGIASIIEQAKKLAPCILFIDEIDLLSLQRIEGVDKSMLSQFLAGMSGCLEVDPEKVVIMIAATNKPENLDKALRQRGRFGKEIRFEYPGFADRKKFLVRKIGALANIDNFDIDQLVLETEGSSFEALNAMTRAAFQRGIVKGQTLAQSMLETCLDEEIRHIIMRDDLSSLTEQEKELIAIHQAGHALATLLLGNKVSLRLAKTTIQPFLTELQEELPGWGYYTRDDQKQKKIKYGRTYAYHTQDTKNINRLADKLTICKICLAGDVAETILLDGSGYGYDTESVQNAFDIAKSVVAEGIKIEELPEVLRVEYQRKALALKQTCQDEVAKLLQEHKEQLQAVAKALLEKKILTGQEVANICGIAY